MGQKKKKNDNKAKSKTNLLLSILIVLIIILITLVIIVNVMNNKKDVTNNKDNENTGNIIYNTEEEVIGDKAIGNITFTNIKCSYDGFRSLLTYTINNNGNSSIALDDYELVVKDNNDKTIAIMVPGAIQEIKAGESLEANNVIDIDLSSVAAIELRLSK